MATAAKNWRSEYARFATKNESFEFLCSLLDNCRTKAEANEALKGFTGGLSTPSKMPCFSYNIPAWECKVGAQLMKVANSTCSSCYAMKGRYVFNSTKAVMYRRFDRIFKPMWVEAMVLSIAINETSGYFRWHDSGDLQNLQHLDNIVRIAKFLPEIKFWLPTREYKVVSDYADVVPQNLTIRFSAHMIDSVKEVANKEHSSIVISNEAKATLDVSVCHATRPEGTHKCDDCRACWNKDVKVVAYLKH